MRPPQGRSGHGRCCQALPFKVGAGVAPVLSLSVFVRVSSWRARARAAASANMGVLEKIADIQHEMSRTQKNKATEYHLGTLKAKLAKLRVQLIEDPAKSGKGKGEGFDVMKSGDARVAMIGFPSVGKSSLLNRVTKTHSVASNYEFTTLTCIPGVIEHRGSEIQLLDLPGIIEGASRGKGRGRQVIAVARTADLVLMMLDASKGDIQRQLLTKELEAVGIRLNQRVPNISFKQTKGNGIRFNASCKLTHCDSEMVHRILSTYKMHNADVLFKEDCTADEFIDVILGNRVYLKCIYCYNKVDTVTIEEVDRMAHQPNSLVISVVHKHNIDLLKEMMWQSLDLIRVYTKKRGEFPDLEDGIVMRKGATVEHVCHAIHRSIFSIFKYALVWGTSTKFSPQRVGPHHVMAEGDVIQIMKK